MISEELCYELKEFTDTEKIKQITKEIDDAKDKKTVAGKIEELQEINNTLTDKIGYCSVVLDFQIYINQLRNTFDITDPREIIHTDNEGFVQ